MSSFLTNLKGADLDLTFFHSTLFSLERLETPVKAKLLRYPAPHLLLPCVALMTILLLIANILIATRLQPQNEQAIVFAALGGGGMPTLFWSSGLCRSPSLKASAVRLARSDLLALLEAK